MRSVIHPPAIRHGDTFAVVAPASVPDNDRIERAKQLLEADGFQVRIYGALDHARGYLAGTDAARAAALNEAFGDPRVQGILCARGGYGCARILDSLAYPTILKNPKVFVGFSDITALHLAIQRRTGLVTFHGPHPNDGLGLPGGWDPRSARSFWRTVMGNDSRPDVAASRPSEGEFLAVDTEELVKAMPRDLAGHDAIVFGTDPGEPGSGIGWDLVGRARDLEVLVPGRARGRVTGGNLAVLCGLMGTPYEIETDGAILLLEDVGEPPYRIDRYLAQLRLGGKLRHLAGVLLGHFTDCQPEAAGPSLSLEEVFLDYFAGLGIPVLSGVPAGHDSPNFTLPLNVLVEIDTDGPQIVQLDKGVA